MESELKWTYFILGCCLLWSMCGGRGKRGQIETLHRGGKSTEKLDLSESIDTVIG